MTEDKRKAALKVNASFFIMDCFDCATAYDHVGTPIGLCVKDGAILSPPLFNREALIVGKDGDVSISMPDLRTLEIEIGERQYRHGENVLIYAARI